VKLSIDIDLRYIKRIIIIACGNKLAFCIDRKIFDRKVSGASG